MIDLDTVASEGSWEAALRAAGARVRRGRAAPGGRGLLCVLRAAPARASRRAGQGDGLLPRKPGGDRRRARALARSRSRSDLRLGRTPRQRHRGRSSRRRRACSTRASTAGRSIPGTGDIAYTGEGEGEGYTVNMPVPTGSGDELFKALSEHVVAPIAREFEPGLIAISAGFDAHAADPLASCDVSEEGYRTMAATDGAPWRRTSKRRCWSAWRAATTRTPLAARSSRRSRACGPRRARAPPKARWRSHTASASRSIGRSRRSAIWSPCALKKSRPRLVR